MKKSWGTLLLLMEVALLPDNHAVRWMAGPVVYEEIVYGTGQNPEEAVRNYLETRTALLKICQDHGGTFLTFPNNTADPQPNNDGSWHIGTEYCLVLPSTI